jgi:hypothetical protein
VTGSPLDAPPLPLSYDDRESLKVGGLPHIVAWFARSLAACDYDFGIHPFFEPYARGVLASPYAPDFITHDKTLQQRFPPRQLKGLGPGLCWEPSVAPIRSAPRWQQRLFLDNQPPHQNNGTHPVVDRQDANVPPCFAAGRRIYRPRDKVSVMQALAARLGGAQARGSI